MHLQGSDCLDPAQGIRARCGLVSPTSSAQASHCSRSIVEAGRRHRVPQAHIPQPRSRQRVWTARFASVELSLNEEYLADEPVRARSGTGPAGIVWTDSIISAERPPFCFRSTRAASATAFMPIGIDGARLTGVTLARTARRSVWRVRSGPPCPPKFLASTR